MVWFQCEDCGDNLKKPKLPGHFNSCSASKLSCLDCGVVFDKRTVQFHTSCISEVEKYGPKGDGKVSTSAPNNSAQKKPADDGTDISVGLSTHPPWKCSLCNVHATSQENLQLHAEGKKHRAKARAAARKEAENQGTALKKGSGGDGANESAAKGSGGDGAKESATKGSGDGENEGAAEKLKEEETNGVERGVNGQESAKSEKKRARDEKDGRTGTGEVKKTTEEGENPAAGACEENGQKKKKKKKNKKKKENKGAAEDTEACDPMRIDGKDGDGGSSRGGADGSGSKDEKREKSKEEETAGKGIGEKGEGVAEPGVKSPKANGGDGQISPETSSKKKKKNKKKKKKTPEGGDNNNKDADMKSPAANGAGAEILPEMSSKKKKNKKNKKRKNPSSNEAGGDDENNAKNGGEAQQETSEKKDDVKKASGTELGKGGSTEKEKELVEDGHQEEGEPKKKKQKKKKRKEDGNGMDAKAKELNVEQKPENGQASPQPAKQAAAASPKPAKQAAADRKKGGKDAEQPLLLSEGKWQNVFKSAFKDAPDGLSLKKLQKSALPLALQQAGKDTNIDKLRTELVKQLHQNRQYAVDGKMVRIVGT